VSVVADPRPAPGGKRRLPVLQSAPADDEAPRPAWQWVVFGALLIVTTWVPAAAIAGALVGGAAARAAREPASGLASPVVAAAVFALALAAGAAAGGYVVGRWGPRGIGVREAALSGLAASVAAAAASWHSLGPTPGVVVVPLVAVAASAAGGILGLRRRAAAG
jgi:hypothetical protein